MWNDYTPVAALVRSMNDGQGAMFRGHQTSAIQW